MTEKVQEVKLEIQINDDVASGQYVNMVLVNHNDSEFVLDCIYVQPQAPKAQVKSRLISSPRNTKRLLLALQQNVVAYEDKYGIIELADQEASHSSDQPIH